MGIPFTKPSMTWNGAWRSQVREIYSMAGANQGILVSSHICMLHAMAEGARTTEIWLCHSCVTLGNLTLEDLGLPGRGWRTQGSWSKAQNCIPKISQNRFEWSKIHWHNWAFHIFWMISACCRSLLARMILILAPITHNEALAFCCEIQLVSTKEKQFWSLALGGILNYCRFIVFLGPTF